ncbi:MAG: HEPN domain-containing protein [Nitrosotalea sp.]
MNSSKNYLKWCAKQKKGIKIITESITLQKAYLKKSEEALKSMNVNAKEGINEWVVSTSYYAKYFAVYALLSRIGIKCEIHDCTISLFEYLFSSKISATFIQDLHQAKDDRVDVQYYTQAIQFDQKKLVTDTTNFVLEIQKIIDKLTPTEIGILRGNLKLALK